MVCVHNTVGLLAVHTNGYQRLTIVAGGFTLNGFDKCFLISLQMKRIKIVFRIKYKNGSNSRDGKAAHIRIDFCNFFDMGKTSLREDLCETGFLGPNPP